MELIWSARTLLFVAVFLVFFIGYIVYQRYFHPLARFPGPFLGSVTNFLKVYHLYTGNMPQIMLDLHQKYGPVVRIGPNDLDFIEADAVAPIFKSGRHMPKAPFYDGFTAFHPNVFGTRDEAHHALRRRQMAHGFSVTSLKKMEPTFDRHIHNLLAKVNESVNSQDIIDLKETFSYYSYDVTGQLAFNIHFNTQNMNLPKMLPPLIGHFQLGNMYGSVANLLPHVRTFASWLPIPWVQRLVKSRKALAEMAASCVTSAIETRKNEKTDTLLTSLIDAVDPETGAKLTVADICSEAFGFLVAGSHTTGGSLTLLFYHILHDPKIYSRIVKEMETELPRTASGIYEYSGLEAKLPYTLACIREGFRTTPVGTNIMPRVVTHPAGMTISGFTVPPGTNASMLNHCLHHNPNVWGPNHDTFDPSRFLPESPHYNPSNANLLLHFGQGSRQCIGRNVALMSMWKILVTLFKDYELELVNKSEALEMVHVGVGEKKGPLKVRCRRKY